MMALDSSSILLRIRILEIQEACSRLHRVGDQDGSLLQCYQSAEKSATAMQVALAVIEHSLPAFEKNRQQLHWPRFTAQAYAAALIQLTGLATSLCNSADKLSHGADSRVTRLPAVIRCLYDKCRRDPLEKDTHKTWWETMVALCKNAQNKGKSWPDSHEVAIQEVADSWEHPNWPSILSSLRNGQGPPRGPAREVL